MAFGSKKKKHFCICLVFLLGEITKAYSYVRAHQRIKWPFPRTSIFLQGSLLIFLCAISFGSDSDIPLWQAFRHLTGVLLIMIYREITFFHGQIRPCFSCVRPARSSSKVDRLFSARFLHEICTSFSPSSQLKISISELEIHGSCQLVEEYLFT